MNKSTYNSLKKNLRKAADEAWKKYYEMVCASKPAEAAQYYQVYEKTNLLEVYLKRLVEEENK